MNAHERPARTRLVVGCGYLGSRVARRWIAAGDRVFAVLPQGISLTQADIDKLVSDGDLAR